MGHLMQYPKVLTLGSYMTDRALVGKVVVQEKVDGSQFRFGVVLDEDGNKKLVMGSHHCEWGDGETAGMFKAGVDYLRSIEPLLLSRAAGTFFFAEYMAKPKHNCIKYDIVPKNNLMLFDVYSSGWWAPDEVAMQAKQLGLDFARTMAWGEHDVAFLRDFMTWESFLGGDKIEGVVIKNYNENILENGRLRPLFTKYVRPEFKEKMQKSAVANKQSLDEFVASFKSEARWLKAYHSFRDEGTLTTSPKDIGPLIVQIKKDILEEEKENIEHWLYRHFINEILGRAVGGFPDWYKEFLVNQMEDKNGIKVNGCVEVTEGVGETLGQEGASGVPGASQGRGPDEPSAVEPDDRDAGATQQHVQEGEVPETAGTC